MLTEALDYASRGWPVFPCKPRAKTPITPHGLKDATVSPEIIKAWWLQNPAANIGIATGSASGFVVLDVDVKNGQPGEKTLAELQREYGAFMTRCAKSPSGGWHFYFKHNGGKVASRAGIMPGLDIRGDGGYIIAPPSVTDVGTYEWRMEEDAAPLPEGLLKRLNGKAKVNGQSKPFDRENILKGVPEGQRDEMLFKYACSLKSSGVRRQEAEVLVRETAANCTSPFPEDIALEKVLRVYENPGYEQSLAAGFLDTDMANSERFARLHADSVFWTPERGWLLWDGKRWAPDEQHRVMGLAKQTARKIFAELETAQDKTQKELFNWARRSQSKDRLQAMLALAQSEPEIPAWITEFDTDPLLLNCINGVVNLATGELLPHNPARMLSKISPIEYHPTASCSLWLEFLNQVMASDAAMIDYLQRAIGYSLTGYTVEQCLFFLLGIGANGKSVFLEIVLLLLAEYGTNARADTFMVKTQGSGIPNDIARLVGMRFVGVNETETGQKMAESLVKDLTGGDTITARFLHREFFTFKPEFKLWIRGNHKPAIRGTDDGIWRRIHLIPFEVQIPEAERDPGLPEKLRAELPGILRWAVEGAIAWQRDGLRVPEKVKAATSEYRTEMDSLADFMSEKCTTGAAFSAFAGNLYKAYTAWCNESGEQPMSQTAFGLALAERGFRKVKTDGRNKYMGIGLNVADSQDRRYG